MKTMDEKVAWFQINYPKLVKDMKEANHHGDELNPYHLESDVFTHTMMVCNMAKTRNELVQWACLLHDLGKPVTREQNKKGWISFYSHDAVSAYAALDVLENARVHGAKLSNKDILTIFKVIALHTQIFKKTPEELGKAFYLDPVGADVFYQLGVCDHNGRFTINDRTESLIPPIVHSDSRYNRGTTKQVTLMCGLPASGKSTYVRKAVENNEDIFLVSRDSIIQSMFPKLTYNEAYERADEKVVNELLQEKFRFAKKHNNVVVDMTHMSKKSRRKSLSHFGKDFFKICNVFITPLTVTDLRNQSREGKIIPDEVYRRMIKSFYPPMMDEFDEVHWIYDNNI